MANITDKQKANLKPLNTRTPRERQEISRKGAEASNKVQAARKTLREELLILLSTDNNNKKISLSLIQQALNGNYNAFITIRDTIGERPTETIKNVNINYEEYIKSISDENEY